MLMKSRKQLVCLRSSLERRVYLRWQVRSGKRMKRNRLSSIVKWLIYDWYIGQSYAFYLALPYNMTWPMKHYKQYNLQCKIVINTKYNTSSKYILQKYTNINLQSQAITCWKKIASLCCADWQSMLKNWIKSQTIVSFWQLQSAASDVFRTCDISLCTRLGEAEWESHSFLTTAASNAKWNFSLLSGIWGGEKIISWSLAHAMIWKTDLF